MLEELIKTYLRGVGFTTYEKDGVEYWGHLTLGSGRTFDNAVHWCIDRVDPDRERAVAHEAALHG